MACGVPPVGGRGVYTDDYLSSLDCAAVYVGLRLSPAGSCNVLYIRFSQFDNLVQVSNLSGLTYDCRLSW